MASGELVAGASQLLAPDPPALGDSGGAQLPVPKAAPPSLDDVGVAQPTPAPELLVAVAPIQPTVPTSAPPDLGVDTGPTQPSLPEADHSLALAGHPG
mmetsp:Transcript_135566/g.343043  ORF Transcript_135566/g.343043 Transcript_135566/m.343043 type:complete len:98 (-) Transcript_135566:1387-1680(-)